MALNKNNGRQKTSEEYSLRWKQIWEALHPEGGNTVSTLGGLQNIGFAADTCVSGESGNSVSTLTGRGNINPSRLKRHGKRCILRLVEQFEPPVSVMDERRGQQ